MLLLVCDMLKLPVWLVQPGVCPVIVNVPAPDPMPIAMLPCMVIVLVCVLPDGVHDIVIAIVPPFIMPDPIEPFITVPLPKHWEKEPMFVKFMLLPIKFVLFWVILNVKEPTC